MRRRGSHGAVGNDNYNAVGHVLRDGNDVGRRTASARRLTRITRMFNTTLAEDSAEMDKNIAARMEADLTGKVLGGWTIGPRLGQGKSAVVFHASRGGDEGAVKVFDRELVQRYGVDAQNERGEREKKLVGQHHPNLIGILDAGYDDGLDLFFVVMEFFNGKNLGDALSDVLTGQEHGIIQQVAAAARFLESMGLAHRDIKPENIGVSADYSKAVLLDLGVLVPVEGYSNVTDHGDEKVFVGTLQYSPPELLFRVEEQTPDGWRAVTMYQLGAVLHDLLTRRPLFAEFVSPFSRLVKAVSEEIVTITSPGAPSELRQLAQDCLVKDPAMRLKLVSWERFSKALPARGDVSAARERIEMRRRSAMASSSAREVPDDRRVLLGLRAMIDSALRDGSQDAGTPPFTFEREDEPKSARIRVSYKRSATHATTAPFALYVEYGVVEAGGRVVSVSVAAAIASADLPRTAAPEWLSQVFYGVEDADAIRAKLEEIVVLAYDGAIEACATSVVAEMPYVLRIADEGA